MKLTKKKLFYLIEQVLKEDKSESLLFMLFNLKKIGGAEEFYKRTTIDYNDPIGSTAFYFNFLVDGEVIGTVNYDKIDKNNSS